MMGRVYLRPSGERELRFRSTRDMGCTLPDPSTFGTLLAWWKADALTELVDGNSVASWPDVSGNGKTATSATNNPTYKEHILAGRPVVRFDGTNDEITTNLTITNPYSIGIVYSGLATGTNRTLQGSANWLIGARSGLHQMYSGAFVAQRQVVTGEFVKATLSATSGTSIFRVNGNQSDGGGGGGVAPGVLHFGASGLTSEVGACDLAEVLVYNTNLSAANILLLEDYFFKKYGI